MNKQAYQMYRKSARANGAAYAMRTTSLGLYEKGLLLELQRQDPDVLARREAAKRRGTFVPSIDLRLEPLH